MRISSIELRDFRCYRSAQVDCAAEVVVFYGRNGAGKTAIFDAIELAFTGAISRFDLKGTSLGEVLGNAKGDGRYSVTVNCAGGAFNRLIVTGSRSADLGPSLIVDSTPSNWSDFFYSDIIRGNAEGLRKNLSTAVKSFNACLMLSQSNISEFLESPPEKRLQVLSTLTGGERLRKATSRIPGILRVAQTRDDDCTFLIAKETSARRNLVESISQIQAGLASISDVNRESLKTQAQIIEATGALLGKEVKELEESRPNRVGFEKLVLALCDEFVAQQNERQRVLTELLGEIGSRADWAAGQSALSERLSALMLKIGEAEKELQSQQRSMEEVSRRISAGQERLLRLRQGRDIRQEIERLETEVANLDAVAERDMVRVEQIKAELDEAQLAFASSEKQYGATLESVGRETAVVEQLEKRVEDLRAIAQRAGTYDECAKEIEQKTGQLAELTRVSDRDREQSSELSRKISDSQEAVAELRRTAAKGEARVEALKATITNALELLDSDECPVCGEAHGSVENVRARIQEQLEKASGADAENSRGIADSIDRVKGLQSRLAEIEQHDGVRRKRIAQLEREIRDLKSKNLQFDKDLQALQLVNAGAQLDELLRQEEARLVRLKHEVGDKRKLAAEQKNQLDRESHRLTSLRESHSRVTSSFRMAVVEGKAKAESKKALLDKLLLLDLELANATLSELQEEIAGCERELVLLEQESEALKSRLSQTAKSLSELNDRLEADRTKLERVTGKIANLNDDLVRLGFTAAADNQALSSAISMTRNGIAEGKRLSADVRAWSRGRQREEDTERLEAIQKELDGVEERLAELKQERLTIREVERTAREWEQRLNERVESAVRNEMEAHAPEINAMFKRMIPFPYSIDEVAFDSQMGINLKYAGVPEASGEPMHYLSAAQLNVLGIAIFLSLAIKQRWAKLDTIFMDDPVQHLDDLDAVAFLDNLRGLALGQLGPKKQIVVSTCDRDLYLLMLQKLSSTGLSVKAYAISEGDFEGPRITLEKEWRDNTARGRQAS